MARTSSGRLAALKVKYARGKGFGGVIIWELGGGYDDARPPGQRDELLQHVRSAAFGAPKGRTN